MYIRGNTCGSYWLAFIIVVNVYALRMNAQRICSLHATRELVLHTKANQCLAVQASCLYHRSDWRFHAVDIFDVVGVL